MSLFLLRELIHTYVSACSCPHKYANFQTEHPRVDLCVLVSMSSSTWLHSQTTTAFITCKLKRAKTKANYGQMEHTCLYTKNKPDSEFKQCTLVEQRDSERMRSFPKRIKPCLHMPPHAHHQCCSDVSGSKMSSVKDLGGWDPLFWS